MSLVRINEKMDLITMNRLERMITNAGEVRRTFTDRQMGGGFDPRRDYRKECGYPATGQIDRYALRDMFDRNPLGRRVVQLYPKECWQSTPDVFENENSKTKSPFELRFKEVCNSLRGKSYYADDKGSLFWEVCSRADELSRVAKFGGILYGLDDGKEFHEPADMLAQPGITTGQPEITRSVSMREYVQKPFTQLNPIGTRTGGKPTNINFMQTFDESMVEVVEYDCNKHSPRYQLPIMYRVTLTDQRNITTGLGIDQDTIWCHWTRFQHLADNINTSEVIGSPSQVAVWDRLLDSEKIYGGSAEMFWLAAFMGISFETHPQLGGDVVFESEKMRSQIERFQNKLQRYLFSSGMTAKTLSPTVSDPTQQIAAIIEAICIVLGCPKRVFMGSERGELASSQDDAAWNSRVAQRQNMYLTPRLIAPIINRLILLGVLPEPKQFSVKWPDLDSLTDKDRAGVLLTRTQAMQTFQLGGVANMMTEMDWFTREFGYSQDEAQAVCDAAKKQKLEQEQEQLNQQRQQMEDVGVNENGNPIDENAPPAAPSPTDGNGQTKIPVGNRVLNMWDDV